MYVRRVIAGVSGSAGSLQALRYAAEMARQMMQLLAPVLAWMPPGGELADRRYPSPGTAAGLEAGRFGPALAGDRPGHRRPAGRP